MFINKLSIEPSSDTTFRVEFVFAFEYQSNSLITKEQELETFCKTLEYSLYPPFQNITAELILKVREAIVIQLNKAIFKYKIIGELTESHLDYTISMA